MLKKCHNKAKTSSELQVGPGVLGGAQVGAGFGIKIDKMSGLMYVFAVCFRLLVATKA